jgi:hypothetical protein
MGTAPWGGRCFSIRVLDGLIPRKTHDVIDEATTFTHYYMSCFVGSGSSFDVDLRIDQVPLRGRVRGM